VFPSAFRRLPSPLRLFLLVFFALVAASAIDAVIQYLRFGLPGVGYLWMLHPGFDFFDYTPRFPYLHSQRFFTAPAFFPWIYPAPAIFVLYPFYLLTTAKKWVVAFLLFTLTAAAGDVSLAWRLRKALLRQGLTSQQCLMLIGAVALLGWPLYFAMQRGNIESLLWIGIAAGVYCVARGRYLAAAMLIGVFGSAKIYPLLFLALLLQRGRVRYLIMGLVAAAGTTLAALWCLEPDVLDAWARISTGVAQWTVITTLDYPPFGIGPDHSLLGLLRQCTQGAILHPAHALNLYLGTVGLITTAVFLLRVRGLPAANQTLYIACAAILLPPTSYDYTLVLMLIPWAWIVLLCTEQARRGGDLRSFTPAMVLFAVALAPLAFVHTWSNAQVYFEGPVRAVALLGLMAIAAVRSLPDAASTASGSAA